MKKVTPEYDEAVRVWAGFDADNWKKVHESVKEKFYDSYDTVTKASEEEDE